MSKNNKLKNNNGPKMRSDRGCHNKEKQAERNKWKQNLQNYKDADDFDDLDDFEDYKNFERFN